MTTKTKTPSRGDWASIIELPRSKYSIDAAIEAAIVELYGPGTLLHGNGKWPRFAPPGKSKSNRAGFCNALSHDVAVVGRFDTDERHLILLADEDKALDEVSRRKRIEQARQQAEQARREREADIERGYARGALQARQEWAEASPANPEHRYLRAKGIPPLGLRQTGIRLIVLMTDGKAIVNVQSIYPNGDKLFMTGARKKGCYFPIGALKDGDLLLICEGVATGITLHRATGYAVACAMDCGNLLPVAKSLRARHPATPFIVCADNDHQTEGNPGVTAGKAAAAAVGCHCIWPKFPKDSDATDYNDMAVNGGNVSI